MTALLRHAPLFSAVVLTSCVNYEEHFTINATGSGSIHSVVQLKGKIAQNGDDLGEKLETLLADTPGVELASYTTQLDGKFRRTEFQIDFDHVKDLQSVVGAEGGGEVAKFFGTFSVEKLSDRYAIVRTVDLSTGFVPQKDPEKEKSRFGQAVTNAVLNNYAFTYHMHFPTGVLESNALEIGEEQRSATWRFPLSQLVTGPAEMRAEIRRPPVKTWLIGGALVALIGASLTWRQLKRRKPR